jgi:hypothetical protein
MTPRHSKNPTPFAQEKTMSRKAAKSNDVLAELDRFLASSDLRGINGVRGALARRLAEEIDSVPPYALPRLASALVQLLGSLGDASSEDAARQAMRVVRQVRQS